MSGLIFRLAQHVVSPRYLRQLALWLVRGLEEHLDPEEKARLEQYRRDRAATEAAIASEQNAVAVADAELAQIQQQRSEVSSQLSEAKAKLETLKGELKKIDEEPIKVDRISNADALRSRL